MLKNAVHVDKQNLTHTAEDSFLPALTIEIYTTFCLLIEALPLFSSLGYFDCLTCALILYGIQIGLQVHASIHFLHSAFP